jgi:GNAT superfamily N-acetyltransferase
MPTLEVIRTFLEMTDPAELRPARLADPQQAARVRVERMEQCPASFYRYLYAEVGRRYHWIDRLDWSEADIAAHLAQACIHLWLLTCAGAPAGYFELCEHEDGSVELAYFGLLQEFLGLGLGKHLLTLAVEQAWALGARRVWLHTCTLDDPAALPNYLKRGFRITRHETYYPKLPGEA